MKRRGKKKTAIIIFFVTFLTILGIFIMSVVKTEIYNHAKHQLHLEGAALFTEEDDKSIPVTVRSVPRGSTWTKAFDLYNEGITEHNFQAFTYDFSVSNNTKDEVSSFIFRLDFGNDAYLMSAWNGSLEIHQFRDGTEYVATVPDLREFHPENFNFDTVTFDGETLIHVQKGDYFIYHPASSMNAMEVPLKPLEGTVPGVILYVAIGEDISDATLDMEYMFHRVLTSEPLFWVSVVGLALWLIALINVIITSVQIKKYNQRHERDNELIKESIETFTGFIDAKDPYTNGHSKRVAEYTSLIAQEMGYEGEELDRVYYVALLHDCGKIGVPDNILGKPGRLTDDEFEVIKSHTVRGGEILKSFKSLVNVGEGALYHHERYDGKGYPEGKKGEDIPLIARMICVADSFDAMNSNRVYRERLSKEYIVGELEKNKGKQFDPQIADIMLRIIREGKIEMK